MTIPDKLHSQPKSANTPDSAPLTTSEKASSGCPSQHKIQTIQNFSRFVYLVHTFFQQRGFTYIKTPQLVVCPGTEPSLEVFATELQLESKKKKLFLATSPEIHLKKAVAQGFEKIYEITSSFRNGEITDRHQPEFLICEWYRSHEKLASLQNDILDLIAMICEDLKCEKPIAVSKASVADLFKKHLDFNFTPQTSFADLSALCLQHGYIPHESDSIDDLFFWLLTQKIESQMPADELIFVEKYPAYQAALANLDEQGWAMRFEAYWKGYELCNAFDELRDQATQRLRSQEDLDKKKKMGKTEILLDEEFFQAVGKLPPTVGVALGLERVFMAAFNLKEIQDLNLFSYKF